MRGGLIWKVWLFVEMEMGVVVSFPGGRLKTGKRKGELERADISQPGA